MSNVNKSPPLLLKTKSYDRVWKQFTTLEPEKQGPAISLTPEGEVEDAVLELEISDITKPDLIDRIITRLNKIYKKDELTQKNNVLEAFET